MALTFGKGNRSVAFNPTSAFPLDARSYFESYALALAAAQSAEAASSTSTQYYFGQEIAVVESGVATLYIIQPDKTLKEVGGKVEINENVFTHDEDGKLNLLNFASAVAGAQLVKGADGKLSWVKPDTSTVEGLSTAVTTLRTDVDNLTANTYTKIQTDEKIAEAVANSSHLKRKIVATLEEASDYVNNNEDSVEYIFMVPAVGDGVTTNDKYDEYMAIPSEDGTRILEKVGSWEVDLSDYAKTEAVQTALNNKVDKADGQRLMTDAEGTKLAGLLDIKAVDDTTVQIDSETGTISVKEISASKVTDLATWLNQNKGTTPGLSENNLTNEMITKLAGIEAGAEKNYIRSVSDQLEVDGVGNLTIKTITSAQVSDLSELLKNKVDTSVVTSLALRVDTIEDHITWDEL